MPTTMRGLLAKVSYVCSVAEGRERRRKADNCFDESIYKVLASVETFLAEQIGRAAA